MAFIAVLALLIAAMLTLDAIGAERNFRRSREPEEAGDAYRHAEALRLSARRG